MKKPINLSGWCVVSGFNLEKGGEMFSLGQIVATPGALAAMKEADVDPAQYLLRHIKGDWGVLNKHDAQQNDRAVIRQARIFSVYNLPDKTKLWVITEADRSTTTFLLPPNEC